MSDPERISGTPLRVWVTSTGYTHTVAKPHCFQCDPATYVLGDSGCTAHPGLAGTADPCLDAGPYTGTDSYPDTNDHTHSDSDTDLRAVATTPRRDLPTQRRSRVLRVSLTAVLLALVASVLVAIGTVMAGPNEKPDHPGHPPKPSPGIGRSAEPPHGRPTPAPVPTPAPPPTPVPTPPPGHFDPPLPVPPVLVLPDTRSSP